MKIACLQFAPQVGDVDNNLNRADAVLNKANPKHLDLLVLPELAFSGYNFRSLRHITPYLEPTTAGITSLWARTTALKYDCVVTVGYPEKVDVTPKWPAGPEYYNSAITVSADGDTLANYRKSFLYYTDETWALEGNGFYAGKIAGLGKVAMGICMDLNPYKFEAPWTAWEFAHHVLHVQANLVILSMAWLTREDIGTFSRCPREPDMETLSYWLARLEPIIRAEAEGEIIVVLANRCGTEDDVIYAGTSAVLGINAGEVKVYGILGRGEKELLVVDTDARPQAKLVSQPNSAASTTTETVSADSQNMEDGSAELESMSTRPPEASRSTDEDTLNASEVSKRLDQASNHTEKDSPSPEEDSRGPEEVSHAIEEEVYGFRRESLGTTDEPDYLPEKGDKISYELDLEGESYAPVSPSDSRFPQAYFSAVNHNPQSSLRSSIGYIHTPPSEPPSSDRPSSPKSRNASRAGQRRNEKEQSNESRGEESGSFREVSPSEPPEPPELFEEPQMQTDHLDRRCEPDPCASQNSDHNDHYIEILPQIHTLTQHAKDSDSPRSSSSPNRNQEYEDVGAEKGHPYQTRYKELSTGDKKAEEIHNFPLTAPEHFESSFTRNPLGPRVQHFSPRPTSTVW